jgi:hypothetical protein
MASKGKLIMDVSSCGLLIKSIHKTHWEVYKVKQVDRCLSDTSLLAKYAKGRHPVITADRNMWRGNPTEGGATAIILHEEVSREQMDNLEVIIVQFFSKHTSKTVRGKQWEISLDGSVRSKAL